MKEEVLAGRRLGALAVIVACASFIPPIGILLGGIAAAWGVNTRRRGGPILLAAGLTGIALSAFVSMHSVQFPNAIGLVRYSFLFDRRLEEIFVELEDQFLDDFDDLPLIENYRGLRRPARARLRES
ncbi:MAG TPA: hypothetical protein VEC75_12975 [Stellaceae bacterium]|nr:hypothetical protein [Stellaceae bacterium]